MDARVTSNAKLDTDIVRRDLRAVSGAFAFKLCSDLEAVPAAKRWLLKGILARGERSAWVAAPGGLKSALLTSTTVAVASGRDWFGHRSKGAAGVVYFALERSDLVERRIKAEILRAGLPHDLPIAVVPATFDLVKADSVKRVLATLRDAETCFGIPVGLAIFDTYAKVVAAGGGDENQAKDVGPIFANLERLQKQIDIHAALISHVGKDENRGPRGSTALPGDLDIVVQITGDVVKTASIIKANDYPEGPLFSFKSGTYEFGTDDDGDPIAVNVVQAVEGGQNVQPSREAKLTANQRTMFGILHAAGTAGLTQEDWNEQGREAGIGVRRKADLIDTRNGLQTKGLIRNYGDRWTVVHK